MRRSPCRRWTGSSAPAEVWPPWGRALCSAPGGAIIRRVAPPDINRRELERYLERVSGRWPLQRALLGGARVDDLAGAGPQRERGPEFVIVLVSEHFEGVPWLERVYQAGTLWDAYEMGDPADVHAYTPQEFERRRERLPRVRAAADRGLELLPQAA
jgi:hypothetical protein